MDLLGLNLLGFDLLGWTRISITNFNMLYLSKRYIKTREKEKNAICSLRNPTNNVVIIGGWSRKFLVKIYYHIGSAKIRLVQVLDQFLI